jgi:RNA-directed DNA polymerase
MPKTYRHLYEQITDFANMHQAYLQARRNKRYCPEVLAFSVNLEKELLQLKQELATRSYRTGRYRRFTIHEPKTRQVAALPFRDRVVHHALCNVIGPIFEATFIYDSYACRKGKGTHAGANRVTQFLRQAQRRHDQIWVLKGDIAQYFPSVDHATLLAIIDRKIKCTGTTWLIEEILESWHTNGKPEKGIPIGNLTSQLWANLYLNELDKFVKHDLKCRWYVRYMDDWIILHNDKSRLQRIKAQIADYLNQHLALQLNTKTNVFPAAQGINFLGYRIWATHRLLRKSSAKRMKHRLKTFEQGYTNGTIELEHITASVMSWLGHASHADTYNLRNKLFADFILRRHINGNTESSQPIANPTRAQ